MKASKTIFIFNHIDNNLTEAEISELKALYKYYHKKYWLFKMTYKYFKKIGPQCELVWDFGQIKVDTLWINQRNCSFTVNIYTFCRVVVMNNE